MQAAFLWLASGMVVQVTVQGPVGAAIPILASFQARKHLNMTRGSRPIMRYPLLRCN